MNNEFQWRNSMRKLNESVEPTQDLWTSIAARIEQEPRSVSTRPRRPQWQRRLAVIAATLVVASSAGLVAYRIDRPAPTAPDLTSSGSVSYGAATHSDAPEAAPRTALDWATPADPKLAAVAQGLDKASADLQAALEARPDAVFLVSMINRTNAQRMRLLRQSAISG